MNAVVANNADRTTFDNAIRSLEAEVANLGAHLAIDSAARHAYTRQIALMAEELRAAATSGRISWAQAAQQAQETRNLVMEVIRGRSTPVGRAMAEQLKREGRTLNDLIARKVQQLYGSTARFDALAPNQRNAVYAEIVVAAGRSNPRVTAAMRRLSYAGRSLLFVSLAISVYTVATAENMGQAAAREVVTTGAGIAGGIAGGALAGLACGPGAPVCVAVGAFVGGALAAFGASSLW